MQERHAFEHEEGRSPVWIGMAWGAVSLLGGVALLAAMLTFDVREIGWSYLNGSGLVIPGTSNVLGTAGLYGAGIFYWMLGGMAWMLVILLEWWGLYRLLHHGRLPRSVVYGGLFLLLFGCLFLTAGHVPGNEWVARHQIQGAGGAGGPFAGNWSVSSVGREIRCAGVFRAGLFAGLGLCRRDASPAVLPGHAAGMACLAYEQEGKKTGATDRSACQGSCPREGQHGRCRFVRSQAG